MWSFPHSLALAVSSVFGAQNVDRHGDRPVIVCGSSPVLRVFTVRADLARAAEDFSAGTPLVFELG